MTGIVFEGGTFRPIFSCGVMDALLSENILLPYCIGVSAGIADGVSYISKQPQRNLEIMQKYRNDKRYMSRSNWKKNKSIFGLDFVFGEIPDHLIPFDWDTFRSYEGTCLVGVTNAKTGQIEYKNAMDMDEKFTMLRATCALPMFFPAIDLDGQKYYDGGLVDPIPFHLGLRTKVLYHLLFVNRCHKVQNTPCLHVCKHLLYLHSCPPEPPRYKHIHRFCN